MQYIPTRISRIELTILRSRFERILDIMIKARREELESKENLTTKLEKRVSFYPKRYYHSLHKSNSYYKYIPFNLGGKDVGQDRSLWLCDNYCLGCSLDSI